jgi:hypothetical protein
METGDSLGEESWVWNEVMGLVRGVGRREGDRGEIVGAERGRGRGGTRQSTRAKQDSAAFG